MPEPPPPAESRTERAPGPADALALVLLLAAFLLLAGRFRFLIDDAFISFRYAANWAEGHGLRYNLGAEPPVEGYSNFLWVALLAAAHRLGAPLEGASQALGLAAGAALVALVFRELRVRAGASTAAAAAGAGVAATAAGPVVWATGGLETAAFALAFFVTASALLGALERGDPARALAAGLCAAALALLRVEGVLWAGALAALAWAASRGAGRGRAGRVLAAYALPVLVAYGAWLAFRRATYGEWVANTVHAKAGLSGPVLARGLRQTATFALTFPLAVPVLAAGALAALGRPGPARARAALACLAGGALVAYHALVGGDWMPMFRFLAPLWPFLGVALGVALARLPRRVAAAAGALVVVSLALPAFDVPLAPRALRERLYFREFVRGYETEAGRWRTGVLNADRFARTGRALGAIARPGDAIATGAIGAVGFYSGVTVYDCNGLVSRAVARRAADGTGTAGHDKRVGPSFFADRRPSWYGATVYPLDAADPDRALSPWVHLLMSRDPDLARTCVLEKHAFVEARDGVPAGTGLAVLAHTDDEAAALQSWAAWSRRVGGRP